MGYDTPSQINLVVENSVEKSEEKKQRKKEGKKERKEERKKEKRKEERKRVSLHLGFFSYLVYLCLRATQ